VPKPVHFDDTSADPTSKWRTWLAWFDCQSISRPSPTPSATSAGHRSTNDTGPDNARANIQVNLFHVLQLNSARAGRCSRHRHRDGRRHL